MKKFLMDLSYKMGFDGDITPEVIQIGQRILDNQDYHNEAVTMGVKDGVKYAVGGMRITCEMRQIKRNNALLERNTIR